MDFKLKHTPNSLTPLRSQDYKNNLNIHSSFEHDCKGIIFL